MAHVLSSLRPDALNVFTLHAELEGMGHRPFLQALLAAARWAGVDFVSLEQAARDLLAQRASVP